MASNWLWYLWALLDKKPEISKACSAFLKCNCKKKCSPSCTCVKAQIACAAFCGCDGKCKENSAKTENDTKET